jgi:hypothetical protein
MPLFLRIIAQFSALQQDGNRAGREAARADPSGHFV